MLWPDVGVFKSVIKYLTTFLFLHPAVSLFNKRIEYVQRLKTQPPFNLRTQPKHRPENLKVLKDAAVVLCQSCDFTAFWSVTRNLKLSVQRHVRGVFCLSFPYMVISCYISC